MIYFKERQEVSLRRVWRQIEEPHWERLDVMCLQVFFYDYIEHVKLLVIPDVMEKARTGKKQRRINNTKYSHHTTRCMESWDTYASQIILV
jgi:hypothetical protein